MEEERGENRFFFFKKRNYHSVTSVGQQVGGQQAGEARVQQPGAFLDPCTRTTLRRTARTRAGGGETERWVTQNYIHSFEHREMKG